jgi:hypothetical protein
MESDDDSECTHGISCETAFFPYETEPMPLVRVPITMVLSPKVMAAPAITHPLFADNSIVGIALRKQVNLPTSNIAGRATGEGCACRDRSIDNVVGAESHSVSCDNVASDYAVCVTGEGSWGANISIDGAASNECGDVETSLDSGCGNHRHNQ